MQSLIKTGHLYQDIVNHYSWERFYKFILVAKRQEIEDRMNTFQFDLHANGAIMGGKEAQKSVNKLENELKKQMSQIDKELRGFFPKFHESVVRQKAVQNKIYKPNAERKRMNKID